MQYLTEVVREIRSKTVALEDARLAEQSAAMLAGQSSAKGSPQRNQAGGDGQGEDTPRGSAAATGRAGPGSGTPGGAGAPGEASAGLEPWQRRQKGLCVALSVGEMERAAFQELFDAGATRYLLRIETSNPALFATLHPAKQSFEHRLQCLRNLKKVLTPRSDGVPYRGTWAGPTASRQLSSLTCMHACTNAHLA